MDVALSFGRLYPLMHQDRGYGPGDTPCVAFRTLSDRATPATRHTPPVTTRCKSKTNGFCDHFDCRVVGNIFYSHIGLTLPGSALVFTLHTIASAIMKLSL